MRYDSELVTSTTTPPSERLGSPVSSQIHRQAAGRVDIRVAADRGKDIVQRLVGRSGVAHAVRRHERESEAVGEVHEGAIAVLLATQTMSLELDAQTTAERSREVLQQSPGGLVAVVLEHSGERTFVAARQAPEPLGVGF